MFVVHLQGEFPHEVRKRYIVRIVGPATCPNLYVFTTPRPAAPNGEWWTFNAQHGYVPVPSNSRALRAYIDYTPAK